jgi:hypothetical protein
MAAMLDFLKGVHDQKTNTAEQQQDGGQFESCACADGAKALLCL